MRKQDRRPDLGIERKYAALGVTLICFVSTLAAPYLTALPLPASVAWPPAGIGLALLMVFGYDLWLAVFLGFAGAGVVRAGAGSAAVLVAAAATAEACAGSWLINRWACGVGTVGRTRSFVRFAVGGGLIAAALGPAFGVPVLTLIGVNPPDPGYSLGTVLGWWIGDGVSTLALAPAILLGVQGGSTAPAVAARDRGEVVMLAAALALSFLVLLTPTSLLGEAHYPVEVVCIPPLLWTAYRFGPRAAALAVVALTIVANAGTDAGLGPFAVGAVGTEVGSRTALNAFLAVNAATTLVLAMVTAERRAAESKLLVLARTDGLTGLANYRAAMDALENEVQRRLRRGNSFAVLFFDLDGLKQINDTHGHLAGNRAIVRLANAIAVNCRAIDTPARIGGDEFCVILPGADEVMAWHVADRITRALAAGGGLGAPGSSGVRACAGVAMYPRDGATAEDLLGAADNVLYGAKKARRSAAPNATRSSDMVRAESPA
jgi:diguanylate cyclase (GGDEF)-like protein